MSLSKGFDFTLFRQFDGSTSSPTAGSLTLRHFDKLNDRKLSDRGGKGDVHPSILFNILIVALIAASI